MKYQEATARRKAHSEKARDRLQIGVLENVPRWQLDVVKVTGHNVEARGREEVNRLLDKGWHLLHIYTLTYKEDGVWRERPMGILGRLRNGREQGKRAAESGPPKR